MRDVQEHPAVRAAAALDDLGVNGERHAIPRAQLHADRVITRHEALVVLVVKMAALAADRLRDQRAGDLFGHDHPGWVELDELHVHQPAAGLEREEHSLAVVLVAAGGAATPEPSVASGGENHRVRLEDGPFPGHQVETVGAEADTIGDEEARDVLVFNHRDPKLLRFAGQRVEDRPARVVARVTGPPVLMRAEVALIQPAIVEPRELAAPIGKLADGVGRLPGHDLDHARMAEEVALAERVGEVLFPRILRIACAQHRIDAARRQHGMGIEPVALAHHQDLASRLGRGDRRAQPGGARADDEHVADPAAARWCGHRITPSLPTGKAGRL